MADTQQVDETTGAAQDAKAERRAARLAKQIGAFAKEHGGAEGQLAYIGQRAPGSCSSARTAAGATSWRPPYAIAEQAVKKAGITVHEDVRRGVRRQGEDRAVRVDADGGHPGRRPEQRLTIAPPVRPTTVGCSHGVCATNT